jgi:two-component system chemotaxis response regulator CheY
MAKILIVDDSNLSRRILRGILEPAGHEIIEASNGSAAIERYFLEKPDLVLLDLLMNGMYGLEVLDKLRELDPQARVVVASADVQSFTHNKVKAAGAQGFINKPFETQTVLNTVSAALQGPS